MLIICRLKLTVNFHRFVTSVISEIVSHFFCRSDSIKVTDFGLSKYASLSPDTPNPSESSVKIPSEDDKYGPIAWMSPEVCCWLHYECTQCFGKHITDYRTYFIWLNYTLQAIGGNWSTRSDMYSYGVVLFEMLSRRIPFAEIPGPLLATAKSIVNGERPTLTTTEENATAGSQKTLLIELMKRCFEKLPENRPTAADVYRRLSAAM